MSAVDAVPLPECELQARDQIRLRQQFERAIAGTGRTARHGRDCGKVAAPGGGGRKGADMHAGRSGRNIVVLSDGTGNSSAKANKTNVWRLFQALDQTRSDQIARYDDGVGTSSNRYLAAFGGAFGWGLKRNVIDLYKFICRNWQPGDVIYGFGFSRGAFTIRVLIGFISREGLVPFQSEDELHRNAVSAYRSYRSKSFPAT